MQTIKKMHVSLWLVLILCIAMHKVYAEVQTKEIGLVVMAVGETSHQQNDRIFVGDVLRTGAGSSLMITFADNAKIVLRSETQVTIENYLYVPEDASQNRVKYTLQQGTMRSITGDAGQQNKSGFRLNTPLAAIGVRGTDFIAQATQDHLKVAVVSGGVSVAPYSQQCRADSYGACVVDNKVEAIANSKVNAVELVRHGQSIEMRSSDWLLDAVKQFQIKQSNINKVDESTTVTTVQQATSEQQASSSIEQAKFQANPIHWGRWDTMMSSDNTLVTATALINAQYQPVSSNSVMGLFVSRDYVTGNLPIAGSVQLRPYQAQVYQQQGTTLTKGEFDSGVLGLNFANKTFETYLYAKATPDSLVSIIHAKGNILSNGAFFSNAVASNATISGMIGEQGRSAGMLFEQQQAAGRMVGGVWWQP